MMRGVRTGWRASTSMLLAAAVFTMGQGAKAQDKYKGDITHAGEFRLRDTWEMNPTASKNTQPSNRNTFAERFKLDLGFRATEKITANLTLLNNFTFGRSAGMDLARPDGVPDSSSSTHGELGDFLTVEQANVSWMMSDNFVLKAGRMNYQLGDGTIMAIDDWQPVPYAFDGALGTYETEFARIQAFAFKLRELGNGPSASGYSRGSVSTSDAERNTFGLSFDLKNMPEVIKSANLHVLDDIGDAVTGDSKNIGQNIVRYGANANLVYSIFDFSLWYEGMAGKVHQISVGGNMVNQNVDANMMQAEAGAKFENLMNSRVFIKWHRDTGTKNGSSTYGLYDPYFSEMHGSAGLMDLFTQGNLTYFKFGATFKPLDSTDVGIAYWIFSKTESGNTASNPPVTSLGTGRNLGNGVLGNSALGNEIDLWAERRFDGGIAALARVSYFSPGNVYSAATPAQNQGIAQAFLQGRLAF